MNNSLYEDLKSGDKSNVVQRKLPMTSILLESMDRCADLVTTFGKIEWSTGMSFFFHDTDVVQKKGKALYFLTSVSPQKLPKRLTALRALNTGFQF